jgi:hypothetical protein
MQKETRLLRKLVHRLAGNGGRATSDPDAVFRAFGEGVVRSLAEPPASPTPTRRVTRRGRRV